MNRMLISATQVNELRVALVKGNILYDLDIENLGFEKKKSNIYKGIISRIEPSLEAVFVNYGENRHGFLPFKEIARTYLNSTFNDSTKTEFKNLLKEGQELMVQIDKEERGHKGAALTTFISLAGSYLVLMPNNPKVGGVSRRISGQEREELREILHALNIPQGMGIIIRTAGTGKSSNDLKWDLDFLLNRWQAIESAYSMQNAPALIYQEGDVILRAIRDYLRQEIDEILVDNQELFVKTRHCISQVKPDFIEKIKLHQHSSPLFSYYHIEKQIETIYQRMVRLPSGGSISIDHTEALVSIDVNSAKATGGNDIEETALNTNIEAAEEIARQLRLRDIGGLIVIDFIDMYQIKNQKEVSNKLRESLEYDRARVQIGNITRFGLLEMSRQRLRSRLGTTVQITCPRCDGQGVIRGIEYLASSVICNIEEEAMNNDIVEIQAYFPIDLATIVLNEKRNIIVDIENKYKVSIKIIPDNTLETPQYKIRALRTNELQKGNNFNYTLNNLSNNKKQILSHVVEKTAIVTNTIDTTKLNTRNSIFYNIKRIVKNIFTMENGTNNAEVLLTDDLSSMNVAQHCSAPIQQKKTNKKINYKNRHFRRSNDDKTRMDHVKVKSEDDNLIKVKSDNNNPNAKNKKLNNKNYKTRIQTKRSNNVNIVSKALEDKLNTENVISSNKIDLN